MKVFKQIEGTKKFFIHRDGYAFKVHERKEYRINLQIKQGIPRVKIGNQRLNLVLLMLEYFGDEIPSDFSYTYKISNDKIPIDNIKIKSLDSINDTDEKLIVKWKCRERANAQNNRVKHKGKISPEDVLNSLKRTDYSCTYCGLNLNPKKWHLDHVQPIGKGGINSNTNLAASCKDCNMMKGSIALDKFLYQVKKIHENYNL